MKIIIEHSDVTQAVREHLINMGLNVSEDAEVNLTATKNLISAEIDLNGKSLAAVVEPPKGAIKRNVSTKTRSASKTVDAGVEETEEAEEAEPVVEAEEEAAKPPFQEDKPQPAAAVKSAKSLFASA